MGSQNGFDNHSHIAAEFRLQIFLMDHFDRALIVLFGLIPTIVPFENQSIFPRVSGGFLERFGSLERMGEATPGKVISWVTPPLLGRNAFEVQLISWETTVLLELPLGSHP